MRTFKLMTIIVGVILIFLTIFVGIMNNGWEDVFPVFIFFNVMWGFDYLITSFKNIKNEINES